VEGSTCVAPDIKSLAISTVSYCFYWWAVKDSNLQPTD
jgi:hypothetical protein